MRLSSNLLRVGRVAAGLTVLTCGAGLGVLAQETPPGMTRVTPGAATRVFIMAAFDDSCRSLPAPAIEITHAPRKGAVQFREGQTTTVQTSLKGNCTGTRVTGTGIYYAARADAAGEDAFTISARLATGEIATRTFQMFISDGL